MTQRLPAARACVVPQAKLTSYLLSPTHPLGAAKAKFFEAHGFHASNWRAFEAALKAHALQRTVCEIEVTPYGRKYTLRCTMQAPDGRTPCVRTVWIDEGNGIPRFVTAYPDRGG